MINVMHVPVVKTQTIDTMSPHWQTSFVSLG